MVKSLLVLFILSSFSAAGFAAPAVDIGTPKTKWAFKAQGPIRGAATLADGLLYVGSSDGFLYAIDKDDGSLVWKFRTQGAITGGAAVMGDAVIVSSRDEQAYALDRSTGTLLWKFKMKPSLPSGYGGWDYFLPTPVKSGDQALVGSGDGTLYALDRATGKPAWQFTTQGCLRATPLLVEGTVYQPSNDGFLHALSADDGRLLWKFQTDGAHYTSSDFGFDRKSMYDQLSLRQGLLVFGSRDGNMYGVDVATGQEKWRFSYGTTWAMASSVDEHAAYVGWSTNDMLCALDLATGEKLWEYQCGAHTYATPLVAGEALYVASGDGNLYKFDKHSAEVLWSYPLGSEAYASPTHDAHALYVGTDSGYLYAIEDGDAPFKAVYHPVDPPENIRFALVDEKIAPYLEARAFVRLSSEKALFRFLEERLADKAPSVIVLAFDIIPHEVMGENPASGLLRQYLESGGKIVSFGSVLNQHTFDAEGNYRRDPTIAERLLDVDYVDANESGNYYSRATQLGMNWGLPANLKTTAAIADNEGVQPLAVDEFGRISAWIKKLNPRPGSGFVSCRSWSYNIEMSEADLELINALALHELE